MNNFLFRIKQLGDNRRTLGPTSSPALSPYAGATNLPHDYFNDRLGHLIDSYQQLYPGLPDLLSHIEYWIRWADVDLRLELYDLNPTCLTLMTIAFLMEQWGFTNLQNPTRIMHLAPHGTLWPIGAPEGSASPSIWCDFRVLDAAHEALPLLPVGSLFTSWLNFWSTSSLSLNSHIVSIAGGGLKLQPSTDFPMIVEDPFLRSFNHAAHIQQSTIDAFGWACRSTIALTSNQTLPQGLNIRPGSPLFWPTLRQEICLELGQEIHAFYMLHRPSEEILEARISVILRVQDMLREKLPSEYAGAFSVQSFGSTAYGIDSGSSDIDLVIVDSGRSIGFPPGCETHHTRLPLPYTMRWLNSALISAGFTQTIPISHAIVPIVKFVDPTSSLHVDINCNNQLGWFNTTLLWTYCEIYPNLRAMIFFIKKWAAFHHLNDPSGRKSDGVKSISSYCYALMAIAYLQIRGALPNLQDPDALTLSSPSEFWIQDGESSVRCDTRIGRVPDFRGANLALGDALYGWFSFFAADYKYSTDVLSIRHGGRLPSLGVANHDQETAKLRPSALVVQDPFILAKNVSSACTDKVIIEFRDKCRHASLGLASGRSIVPLFEKAPGTSRPLPIGTRLTPRAPEFIPGRLRVPYRPMPRIKVTNLLGEPLSFKAIQSTS